MASIELGVVVLVLLPLEFSIPDGCQDFAKRRRGDATAPNDLRLPRALEPFQIPVSRLSCSCARPPEGVNDYDDGDDGGDDDNHSIFIQSVFMLNFCCSFNVFHSSSQK